MKRTNLDGFPPRPGGRYEEELVDYEVDWCEVRELISSDEVVQCLAECGEVLEAIDERCELPSHASLAARQALNKIGRLL